MAWEIERPCGKQWGDLSGDGAKRYCDDCGKYVHDLAAFSDAELRRTPGLCGYSGNLPVYFAARRTMLAGVLLTTISPLLAQNGQLQVVVKDRSGSTVSNAEVVLDDGKPAVTNRSGVALFTGLRSGSHRVTASAPGFRRWIGASEIGMSGTAATEIVLDVGSVGGPADPVHAEPVAISHTAKARVLVTDPLGKPVGGAHLEMEWPDGKKLQVTTDAQGAAALEKLTPGAVAVTVEAAGLQAWRKVRDVAALGETEIPVELALAPHTEKVLVKEPAGRRFWNWLTSCTRK
jgi:hypothetical protein